MAAAGAAATSLRDRFGLGWRPELAAELHLRLDRLDLVEVIADDWMFRPAREQRALRALAEQVTLTLHGVSLGLCSAAPVDERRLAAFARLVERVRPAAWSEHLAFVRGGGAEIGHLAAPPRTDATLDGLARNVARARSVVGTAPQLENVATLVDPPGSDHPETAWLPRVAATADAPLLLDLHNLFANAHNFGFDAIDVLDGVPWERVQAVHIAGGRAWRPDEPGVERARWLDDHRHAVPEAVYDLLREAGRRATGPLDVVLERDGDYPSVDELLAELDRARAALAAGRAAPLRESKRAGTCAARSAGAAADARRLEALLARAYTEPQVREALLADAAAVFAAAGLPAPPAALDAEGLRLAARSFAARRRARPGGAPQAASWREWLRGA